MSGKVIAQLIIGLTTAGTRVFVQAYQQALSNAKRGGAAQAAGGAAISAIRGKMQADEAKQILNLEDVSELDEKKGEKFKRMYDLNSPDAGGSFYLQSKIYRAKEALFKDMNIDNPLDKPEAEGGTEAGAAVGEEAKAEEATASSDGSKEDKEKSSP